MRVVQHNKQTSKQQKFKNQYYPYAMRGQKNKQKQNNKNKNKIIDQPHTKQKTNTHTHTYYAIIRIASQAQYIALGNNNRNINNNNNDANSAKKNFFFIKKIHDQNRKVNKRTPAQRVRELWNTNSDSAEFLVFIHYTVYINLRTNTLHVRTYGKKAMINHRLWLCVFFCCRRGEPVERGGVVWSVFVFLYDLMHTHTQSQKNKTKKKPKLLSHFGRLLL